MKERLTPDTQRHIQVLQRYMLAMESGDIDSMAIVLCEAEQDRALENMILILLLYLSRKLMLISN